MRSCSILVLSLLSTLPTTLALAAGNPSCQTSTGQKALIAEYVKSHPVPPCTPACLEKYALEQVCPELFVDKIEIDTSETAGNGRPVVTIFGGAQSKAARLYQSLSKIEGIPDSDMGNVHYSETKKGKAVTCEFRSAPNDFERYVCWVPLTTAGENFPLGQ